MQQSASEHCLIVSWRKRKWMKILTLSDHSGGALQLFGDFF